LLFTSLGTREIAKSPVRVGLETPSAGPGGFLDKLLGLFGQGEEEIGEDDFYKTLNEAMAAARR